MKQKNKPKFRNGLRQVIIGFFSFVAGLAMCTASCLLLIQSLKNHKEEVGDHYTNIRQNPFQNSNWMKSSLPIIVVSSIGIGLGTMQVLSSVILLCVNRKLRILGLVIWLGSHIMIFICNIICFSLTLSVKAHENKHTDKESHIMFWKNFQFGIKFIHNVEGLVFASFLLGNSLFILVSISLTAPILYQYDRSITLPKGSY